MNYNKFLQIFSLSTLCVLFGLMFMGGYVSSSGVGLSCPEWPLCPHGLIPSNDFIIEYTHRTIAATTGLLVFLTMIFILRAKKISNQIKFFSIVAAGAVLGQIILGAIVITEKLHALLVTAHLGLGLILYSSMIYIVINIYYNNKTVNTTNNEESFRKNENAIDLNKK